MNRDEHACVMLCFLMFVGFFLFYSCAAKADCVSKLQACDDLVKIQKIENDTLRDLNITLKDQRDEAIERAIHAEKSQTGLLEVGACIAAGAGLGFIGGNTLLGASAAGLGCALALPF